MGERIERGARGQLGAAHRESQAVTGHRIDEAGGVARQEQAGQLRAANLDGQRSQHNRRMREPGAREPIAQQRVAGQLRREQRCRIAKRLVARARRLDETHVGEAAGDRGHADVAPEPDVHFAQRRQAAGVLVVGADGPAPGPRRMAGEAEREGQRRSPPVGGDRRARAQQALASVDGDDDAADRRRAVRGLDDRAANRGGGLEAGTGGDRLLQQRPIEITASQRASVDTVRVTAVDRDAARTGHAHAIDAQTAIVNRRRQPQPPQPRQRAGIDGVAAQLVARKDGAIEQPHARAGAREDRRGDRTGRTGADDQDIVHGEESKGKVQRAKEVQSTCRVRRRTSDLHALGLCTLHFAL